MDKSTTITTKTGTNLSGEKMTNPLALELIKSREIMQKRLVEKAKMPALRVGDDVELMVASFV